MSSAIKLAYASSSNLTVTNLHSLASSQTWIAGWGSAYIDNTTNLYDDYLITGKFTLAASNNQAGQINIGVAGMLDDSTDITLNSGTAGTEGAINFVDTEEAANAVVIAKVLIVDSTASAVHFIQPFSVASLFGGVVPAKFFLFIAGNCTTTTTAQFAASGNQITQKGVFWNVG